MGCVSGPVVAVLPRAGRVDLAARPLGVTAHHLGGEPGVVAGGGAQAGVGVDLHVGPHLAGAPVVRLGAPHGRVADEATPRPGAGVVGAAGGDHPHLAVAAEGEVAEGAGEVGAAGDEEAGRGRPGAAGVVVDDVALRVEAGRPAGLPAGHVADGEPVVLQRLDDPGLVRHVSGVRGCSRRGW